MTAVDVAIVNWNTSSDAIASARAYAASRDVDVKIVIFDNASEPEQRSILDGVGSAISVALSDENLGFGAAANRALGRGSAEFILVSNADVLPEETAVAELVKAFRSMPECGIVAPVMEDDDGYHDELPGPFTLLIRIPVGGFNRKTVRTPGPGEVQPVGQPAGACFLTSRVIWEQVGGFDERFFLWYEDVDLAKRTRNLGYRHFIAGNARVRHLGGRSFSSMDADAMDAQRVESIHLYAKRHHPLAARLIGLISPPVLTLRHFARRRSRRMTVGGKSGE